MTIPAWGLLGVFTSTFVAPFVSAVTPVPLALPQTVRYDEYIASQIARAEFSSDPRHLLSIYKAAGQEDRSTQEAGPFITAFIYSGSTCSTVGDQQKYRIVLHNIGNEPARSISVQNLYPEFTSLLKAEPEAEHDPSQRLLTWSTQELPSGGTLTFYFSVKAEQAAAAYLDNLTVYYSSDDGNLRITIGERAMSGVCTVTDSIRSFIAGRVAPKPAIFCDPAEPECSETYGKIELGPNYRQALLPSNQPTICSLHDQQLRQGQVPPCQDNTPQLGPRFAEAMADILPGECRTVEDNRIILADLNEALNRRSRPASFYLSPLNGISFDESGNDFKRLVHENSLLGVRNLDGVRNVLMPVHNSNWNELLQIARDVLSGAREPDAAVVEMRNQTATWTGNVRNKQASLNTAFTQVQEQRRDNFVEIICAGGDIRQVDSCKLLFNAQRAIRSSCCPLERLQQQRADQANNVTRPPGFTYECPNAEAMGAGGLEAGILEVQQAYGQSLNNSPFAATQARSLNDYSGSLNEWVNNFSAAANEFEAGDREAMTEFVVKGQEDRIGVFAEGIMKAYREHALADIDRDNDIRLDVYKEKLNPPIEKTVSCAKELPSCQRTPEMSDAEYARCEGGYDTPDIKSVELTMCENGAPTEPVIEELNLQEATHEAYYRQPVAPPLITQVQVNIDQRLTFGSPCSGRPGDPWWAEDCSCDCGEIVSVAENSLQFCNAGEGYYTTGGSPPPSGWPRPDGIPEPYVNRNIPNSLAGWWQVIKYSSRQGLVKFDISRNDNNSLPLTAKPLRIGIWEKLVRPVKAQGPPGILSCGNNVIDPGEACDPPGIQGACPVDQVCNYNCQCTYLEEPPPIGFCGDGIIDTIYEACDPAAVPDGCAADMQCDYNCVCTANDQPLPEVPPPAFTAAIISPPPTPPDPPPPDLPPNITQEPVPPPTTGPIISPVISPVVSVSPIPPPPPPDPPPPDPPPPDPPVITAKILTPLPTISPLISISPPPTTPPSALPVISPLISISPPPIPPTPASPVPPPPPPTPVIPTPPPSISPTIPASPSVSPSVSPSAFPSPSISPSPCPSVSPKPSPGPSPSPGPAVSPMTSPVITGRPTPTPSIKPIIWHDIWVTSREECLANFQGCHHFNSRGTCQAESPPPSPLPTVSPPVPSPPPPSPSIGPTLMPSPVISPKICVNPDGTIVIY